MGRPVRPGFPVRTEQPRTSQQHLATALFMDTHTSGGRGTFAWDPLRP